MKTNQQSAELPGALRQVLALTRDYVLKPCFFLVFQLVALVFYLASFGSLNLNRKGMDESALARIWGFLWPFLSSQEKAALLMPASIALPAWHYDGIKPQSERAASLAKAVLLGGAVFACWLKLGPELLQAASQKDINLGQWLTNSTLWLVLIGIGALHMVLDTLFQNVKLRLPSWTYAPIPLKPPLSGKTLGHYPEWLRTWSLIVLIGAMTCLVNYYALEINSLNSRFMNAIVEKKQAEYLQAMFDLALVLGQLVIFSPIYGQVKRILMLDYMRFITRLLLRLYTENGNHYVIALLGKVENAAERIEENAKQAAVYLWTMIYDCIDSVITLYLFGELLWSVEKGLSYNLPLGAYTLHAEHLLFFGLFAYALLGTNLAARVGAKLNELNKRQSKLSAFFRAGLVLFQKFAEPIAVYRGETREYGKLWQRYEASMDNSYAIAAWQRNLGFFTSAYGRAASFAPYAALAPFYFAGQILWGQISKASGACAEVLGALSILVNRFETVSELLAAVNRIGELREELERIAAEKNAGGKRVEHKDGEPENLLSVKDLTLYTPFGKLVVSGLSFDVKSGERILVIGPSGCGKSSIFRSIEDLRYWNQGAGAIHLNRDEMLALSQLAYTPEGDLREQLLYGTNAEASDEELMDVLVNRVKLGAWLAEFEKNVAASCPSWDKLSPEQKRSKLLSASQNWDTMSGGEKQRLVFARALLGKEKLILLDEATSAVGEQLGIDLYAELAKTGKAVLSIAHNSSLLASHNRVVELLGDGQGSWKISS